MKNLGARFYKDFIGIEKPLVVEAEAEDGFEDAELSYTDSDAVYVYLQYNYSTDEFSFNEIKPYLRTVESLSDEEWLLVFGSTDENHSIIRHNKTFIEFKDSYGNSLNCYDFRHNSFMFCNQEILNRLYSLHCHPKAKQLIVDGLALEEK